ncbi:MAG TPA: hypothetical protein PLX89_06390 [Verrucomicrobiota bacterium]|nr:hypothetical protein [Verrucomicrobiales bacterium]HRI12619.1 hypothetical protein [Verrucomicrobiota bacterium]
MRTPWHKVLPLILGIASFVWAGQAQVNLLGWTFRVGGQAVQLNPDGSIVIPNIAAPDQFGPGGPGTRPDFVSDDFVRAIGRSNDEGVPLYAFSEFFRVEQGKNYTIQNWTFTSIPPPAPVSLRMTVDKPALTEIGENGHLSVIGILADGTEMDLTSNEAWTTYRTSNANVVGVDDDGLLTARGPGVAFLTAINEGATGVLEVDVALQAELTTIRGVAFNPAGDPVPGLSAFIIGAGGTATTSADGVFTIVGVAADRRLSGIIVRGSTPAGLVFGKSGPITTVAGGLTDAGIITVRTCADLGIDCTDTDNDCIPDSVETAARLNPLSPDSDNDGIPDGEEDTDGDGFRNCAEVLQGTDPGKADTDGDGLSDRDEIYRFRTDPSDADTDRDGMKDGAEIAYGTDPFNPDTDGDGFDDNTELSEGMNPLVADPGLVRTIASSPVSFLKATFEDLPGNVLVRVQSAPASYLNAQTVPQIGSALVSVSSSPVSYLNALFTAPSLSQFVVSPIVTFRRDVVSANTTSPAAARGVAILPLKEQ